MEMKFDEIGYFRTPNGIRFWFLDSVAETYLIESEDPDMRQFLSSLFHSLRILSVKNTDAPKDFTIPRRNIGLKDLENFSCDVSNLFNIKVHFLISDEDIIFKNFSRK